jgi:hypothetical protein
MKMSKSAINEMLRASIAQFERMINNLPISDKKVILKSLMHRMVLLENI